MKNAIAAVLLLTACSIGHAEPAASSSPSDFPYVVPFELGDAEFAPGDNITITSVRGTRNVITTNETYCVEGTYQLTSQDAADLSLFATVPNSGSTPIDPRQVQRVAKGTGSFKLIKTMDENGYLHITFYSLSTGSGFGGVYFGQGDWVLHKKGWSYLTQGSHSWDHVGTGESANASVSGANETLFRFLGDPVPAPADVDPAYSREGVLKAINTAARNAGVTLERVEVDDSEFPPLLGVVTRAGEFEKVRAQLGLMKEYNYGGSVGSDTLHAFNMVPYPAFPHESSDRISHRLMLRQQVLFDRVLRHQ